MAKSTQNFEEDPELEAMRNVFAALRDLDSEAQNRVVDYVERRLDLQRAQTRASSLKKSAQAQPEFRLEQEQRSDDDEEGKGLTEEGEVDEEDTSGLEGISPVAKKWMQRNGLSSSRMSALYTLGVASYLSSGSPRIDNAKLTLTTRGLNSAKDLIKQMTKEGST